ncbi:hypothetical protein CCMA1212_007873 [Trichoderma ghanense]|uniref:Uncharacterized protein n=1 Tax=Trichoderma ghanense TaxID=65468 RepID=A0ABY2GX08_9HYPO
MHTSGQSSSRGRIVAAVETPLDLLTPLFERVLSSNGDIPNLSLYACACYWQLHRRPAGQRRVAKKDWSNAAPSPVPRRSVIGGC